MNYGTVFAQQKLVNMITHWYITRRPGAEFSLKIHNNRPNLNKPPKTNKKNKITLKQENKAKQSKAEKQNKTKTKKPKKQNKHTHKFVEYILYS